MHLRQDNNGKILGEGYDCNRGVKIGGWSLAVKRNAVGVNGCDGTQRTLRSYVEGQENDERRCVNKSRNHLPPNEEDQNENENDNASKYPAAVVVPSTIATAIAVAVVGVAGS